MFKTSPHGTRHPTFTSVELESPLGPARLVADEHLVRAYSFAQDDYHPWYREKSPVGRPFVPPGSLANELLLLYYYHFRQQECNAIHVAEQLSFHNLLFYGETVTVTGRYVDKYMKRGRGYVVLESEARAEDGRLILSHRGTEIMDGVTAPLKRKDDTAVAPLVSSVPVLQKTAQMDQVSVFSNAEKGQINIHNNSAFARTVGLESPVVQGMQQACYLIELGMATYGIDLLVSGTLDLRFIAPLYVGATAEVGGEVTQNPDGERLECWVRDIDGRVTTVGTVSIDASDREASAHRVQSRKARVW